MCQCIILLFAVCMPRCVHTVPDLPTTCCMHPSQGLAVQSEGQYVFMLLFLPCSFPCCLAATAYLRVYVVSTCGVGWCLRFLPHILQAALYVPCMHNCYIYSFLDTVTVHVHCVCRHDNLICPMHTCRFCEACAYCLFSRHLETIFPACWYACVLLRLLSGFSATHAPSLAAYCCECQVCQSITQCVECVNVSHSER